MKPFRTLLFLLCVLVLLMLISHFMPAGGLSIGNVKLRFPSLNSIFLNDKINYADITKIISDTTDIKIDTTADKKEIPDSLFAATIAEVMHPLQFSDSPGTALWKFYETLVSNKGLIRVIHYGDSQIEGDRMTGYLRQRFQERFGGKGIGFVPAKKVSNVSLPVILENTGDWARYTLYGKRDTTIKHNKFGPSGSLARFSPVFGDTLKKTYEAAVMISHNVTSYKSAFQFTKLKVLFSNITSTLMAELTVDDQPSGMNILGQSNDLTQLEWTLPEVHENIKIEFTSESSPDVLGFLLDPVAGIAFDNIPMRGSSGTDFTRMDAGQLGSFFRTQNVKLIIYQFGVNVVPIEHDDYTFYENWVYSQLAFLKRLSPDLCILVVGVSDMSKKVEGKFVSYPNIIKIRNAQKKAAFRAGCAFWDTYEAMGGENSMPSWVNADPTLASPDYTHFNHSGAQIIARMLYKALMADYESYMRKHPKTESPL
jgi:hypothetical protein